MKKELNKEEMISVIEILDDKLDNMFWNRSSQPLYYLMWGSCIILDKINNISYTQTKDLDFIWKRNTLHDHNLLNYINQWAFQCIPANRIDDDELFMNFEIYPERHLIEFIDIELMVDDNCEYTDVDFMEDVANYFTNKEYNYLKYIRVCDSFIPWYSRLVMSRLKNEQFYVGTENLLESSHIKKSIKNINSSIEYWLITKQEVEEKIGYLVFKYHGNNQMVIDDFYEFMSAIK